ncbi:MAG: RsmB/NOP family class I SAM-dependent RNA methyltransferase [Synergistaceae bacterium]|nr:RsmB/NOP family class I SAM-dependent RNA methyltransferase [Synergistaceae bacterium]
MRGIEGALKVWREVRNGGFASEIIRKNAAEMSAENLTLCSSLVYAALRRFNLWQDIYSRFVKAEISSDISDALIIGTAGLLELKHFEPAPLVSGIVNEVRKFEPKACGLVNAILRKVEIEGVQLLNKIKSSPIISDKALAAGIPKWVLPLWQKSWGNEMINELLSYARIRPYSSLRVSGETAPLIKKLRELKLNAWQSPLIKKSIRISTTVFPVSLPGYADGEFSPQTESSMIVGGYLSRFYKGGHVLDMCSGRGVKALQFTEVEKNASIECWDLSANRTKAAIIEAKRLKISGNITFRTGDALKLEPIKRPSLVLLDAPCSGSGTWNRRPEAKLRTNRSTLDGITKLQANLLDRALSLILPGGVIIYSTCSLFREENENIAAKALTCGSRFLPLEIKGNHQRRGSPFGVYIMPSLPWLDGFYTAVIMR